MSTHWQLIVYWDAKNFDAADAFDVGQRCRLLGSASMPTSCVEDNFDISFDSAAGCCETPTGQYVLVHLLLMQSSPLEWWDMCHLRLCVLHHFQTKFPNPHQLFIYTATESNITYNIERGNSQHFEWFRSLVWYTVIIFNSLPQKD